MMDSEINNDDDNIMIVPKFQQQTSKTLYLAAISSLLGAIAMGMTIGWTSPAFDTMSDEDSIPRLLNSTSDENSKTWIGSSMNLGALVGGLISGSMAQIFGRKKCLIVYGLPFTLGWILLIFSKTVPLIIFGRIICGLSTGLLSGTAPTYVVEIATINVRGFFGTSFQLFVTFGVLLIYLIGAFLNWHLMSAVALLPGLLMSLLMFFMPESPSWLLSKNSNNDSNNNEEEALKSLKRLRGPKNNFKLELELLKKDSEQSKLYGFKWNLYLNSKHLKPLLISLCLMFFQQFSGINAIMFYSTTIFKDSGSSIEPKYATIIIGLAMFFCTIFTTFLVDRLGRKILLILSSLIHMFSLALLSFYYFKLKYLKNFGWLPLICLVLFIIGFSIGWGPISWFLVAEITPQETRSSTSALATAFVWICSFFITKFFQPISDCITPQGIFLLFSLICFISILFTVYFLPETKGKTNEEIRKFFD